MGLSNYDVVVVGAGAAGLTAAIGLARSGFAVAVVEAAAYPGAENWSGCVYFAENLAHPDILGPNGVEELAWERRLVERGFFTTDGLSLLGMKYRDPVAFRHCYTVLRPIYDHHLAQIARRHGVALITETTAECLIRDNNRIVGLCTQRGPLYADLVFLAEGDASHLVTREGYERFTDQREAPKFLQGLKQVIDMPPGAIEEIFGVGTEDGCAYEMLLRNGTMRGRRVRLNMGGFVYTNRQSLSVGLVLPADNLNEHFDGDPHVLMEWFENLPALQPWLQRGRRGVFGAKIIRGGGLRDVPNLIDDGLAIGGAASAIGIDFPYPNFTGPATAMGLLLVQAARSIRSEGGGFSRDALRRHYLEPLQRTHYWQDVDFLRHWPAYVKRTSVFFGSNIDLALGSAYVWTRPNRWFLTKWINWLSLVGQVAGPNAMRDMGHDLRHLGRALRVREIAHRPALGQLLLDGTVNALRDLFGRPRANLPEAGTLRLHYYVAGNFEPAGVPPRALRLWFRRLAPVLAAAARRIYANNDTPLVDKLPAATNLLTRQVNILDLITVGVVGLATGISAVVMKTWGRLQRSRRRGRPNVPDDSIYLRYASVSNRIGDMTPSIAAAAQSWEASLGLLPYRTVKASHIHLLWPRSVASKDTVVNQGLWHVCPAHVYEARVSPLGQLQVIVNFENCIKCETCWRTSDLVDWGRDGRHRFIYAVSSPVVVRLIDAMNGAGTARAMMPYGLNWWEPARNSLAVHLPVAGSSTLNGQESGLVESLRLLADRLERKLQEFDLALAEEPRTVDHSRAEYLEMLARYVQRLAERMYEVLREHAETDNSAPVVAGVYDALRSLLATLVTKAQERARGTWRQRYAWAAADGRLLRWHHLSGLRQFLDVMARHIKPAAAHLDPLRTWLRAEENMAKVAGQAFAWTDRLDTAFPQGSWRRLERREPLSSEADALLRDLAAQVPSLDRLDLSATLHPPLRKALLADLGRRDPSLGYRLACHLWARDLAELASGSYSWTESAARIRRADGWACFAALDSAHQTAGGWRGEALFVPACEARTFLLLLPNQLILVAADSPGLRIEPLASLGLRGAGLARLRLDGLTLPETRTPVDHDRIRRVWNILSGADLTSIGFGMADELCRRTIAHAISRVQFPGLFHDEEARDTIGKFGAVKQMVAAMGAGRYVIETLDQTLSPTDFSSSTWERSGLIKALVAEILGTAPGSLSYNAGQVFGGTGYSEDDMLAKYYRDAAAWRFLGAANTEIYRRHGHELLRDWLLDGHQLTTLPDEAELFEQVTQRSALQAELDEVRNARSRIRGVIGEWRAKFHPVTAAGEAALADEEDEPARSPERALGGKGADPIAQAEISEGLARQNAHLLASKAIVLRTHARLEEGHVAELGIALIRVWLDKASATLEEFEGTVQRWLEQPARDDRPVVELTAGPPATSYSEYLARPCPYDSGDFLTAAVNLLQPRFVPDMIQSDPELAQRDQEIRGLMTGYFGRLRAEGVPYERYIERQHRPDEADLDFCRRHGFFRLPIPKELGGEERRKIDYYLVTTNAQRLADVGISLAIQANTSIGTTPVLLARNKDLPRAQKELGAFVGNIDLQRAIADGLEGMRKWAAYPESRRLERAVRRVRQHLDDPMLGQAALRSSMQPFHKVWRRVCRLAANSTEASALRAGCEDACAAWTKACARASEMLDELGRRRQACDLFLQWVAQGQISAFALTEPSAGSDTARVATRARLRSVPVEVEPDGVLRFVPVGAKEPRYLLDAGRLEFRSGNALYRWSENAGPTPIGFDEYDYETDDPRRMRYYDHGARRVHFADVAQIRKRDGRLWYDYWELTGAKMWITNGRMMGIMALYAKTEEDGVAGVTGFMVDRHAEGLVVGKDEDKLGQCGSPTNELSLQAVRVPRENVLGLEGRGQVNALETLNVGRAGIAMSAMAQIEGLIESSRGFARETHGGIPAWVHWRILRMEEARFTAEALANEVIGRFEHLQTQSVRMESAIAKMLVSEALHTVIELAEEIHGLVGQTQLHLVEKRKRDARVLNIYEGTNEVQRFSILKDLVTEVAPRWAKAAATAPAHVSREVLELETLKATTKQRLLAAVAIFGQGLWQNPNLQANCFLLAEAAAWLKAADSTLGRLAWLSRRELGATDIDVDADQETDDRAQPTDLAPNLAMARRALAHCFFEIRQRLQRFEEELTHLRRGFYAPAIRAANLLYDRQPGSRTPRSLTTRVARPVSILVVLDALTAAVPQPLVAEGRLLEAHLTINDADRSALETAFRLREEGKNRVSVQVAAVGSRATVPALREILSLGADWVRLIVPETDAVTPDSAAVALALALEARGPFELVLGGGGNDRSEEGLLARLTAEALGVFHAGSADQISLQASAGDATLILADAEGRNQRVRSLPAAVAINPGLQLRSFTIAGYLGGLAKNVELVRWPRRARQRPESFVEAPASTPAAATDESAGPLSPTQAAHYVLARVGLTGATGANQRYDGAIEDVTHPTLLNSDSAWILVVLAAETDGRLLRGADATVRAAQLLASVCGTTAKVLLVTPEYEESQRRALAQLLLLLKGDMIVLAASQTDDAPEVRARLLAECWPELTTLPKFVVGESWTEATFAAVARRSRKPFTLALRVRRMDWQQERMVLTTGRAGGKLSVQQSLDLSGNEPCWISVTEEVEIGNFSARAGTVLRIQRWRPRLERFFGQTNIRALLEELKQEAGIVRLADAEFIIDVGCGVGNQDGYETVIVPLLQALEFLGVHSLVIAGSRKVTEELHLLPPDRQIGQSGVSVNPQVLLAIGISGAPQHLNYIGPRATILAFNRDPEAPIMTLNQRQARPRVLPIVGDLFQTVPALTAALIEQSPGRITNPPGAGANSRISTGAAVAPSV
jgi:alkylation response protein AidB-like acyl-CoA dehydrogenase/flavin-dependent dehydrogenase/electron transfer flavoprotein alpha/beta subunit/ferredoxin-like protein FixX